MPPEKQWGRRSVMVRRPRTTPIPSDPRRKATQVETHPSQTAAQQLGQTEALIRFVEALGAYEFNRWIADGMLCRRYISPDGNIDLTVRVP